MLVLGIETSCDETAAAVVEDGRHLLSNVVASQIDIHAKYGGVVPEIAARSHIEVMLPVVEDALETAGKTWDDINAISVTNGPGLSGSLLIGTLTARTLALIKNKPLYPVNHVEGHVYANFLLEQEPQFPMLALIVSGGHSQLVLFHDHFDYRLLGQTMDDAVGEAFDKVAKILGLSYPGGPAIAAAAENGNPKAVHFPKAQMAKRDISLPANWIPGLEGDTNEYTVQGGYDFSFSGLKTAVLRHVQQLCGKDYSFPSYELAELLSESQVNDIAASFQYTAIETLVDKTVAAFDEFQPKSVVIAGGVAASRELRSQLRSRLSIEICYADPQLCTDNAAMIAALGYYAAQSKKADSPYEVTIEPSLSM